MFNIRYPEMHKVQGAICAISKLVYGFPVCTNDKHSLKLVAYRLVYTVEPYINMTLSPFSSSTRPAYKSEYLYIHSLIVQ